MKMTRIALVLGCFMSMTYAQSTQPASSTKIQPIRMFEKARAKGHIPNLKDVKVNIHFESAYQIKEGQADPLDTAFIRVSYQTDEKSMPISAILRPQSNRLNVWESILPKTGELSIGVIYVDKRKVQISELGPSVPLQFGKQVNYKVLLDKDKRFSVKVGEK